MTDVRSLSPDEDPVLYEVMRGLSVHLSAAGSVVSANPDVLARQFHDDGIDLAPNVIAGALDRLVEAGWLRTTTVRGEPHLLVGSGQDHRIHADAPARRDRVETPQRDPEPRPPVVEEALEADPVSPADEQRFRLDVELDVERERLVLWRTVIVVEVLALLILIRQWGLWYLDL